MAYYSQTDEDDKVQVGVEYDEIFRARGRPLPRALEVETSTAYRRRLAETVQKDLAPNCKDFDIRQSTGSAFNALEKQIRADAQREALRPTDIAEGTLKEVTRFDQSGRPFYEFFGSPKSWMRNFEPDDKRYLKSILDTRSGWQRV
jgi:hypothetical protein